jgi:uncharacterized repeat protein (TIGR01451 family)
MFAMKRIVSLLTVLGTMGYAATASALGTAANTQIDNTANATFIVDGSPVTASSDVVTFFVDEVLDVDVTGGDAELVGTDGTDDVDQIVTFTVTNTGNGAEDFKIAVDLAVTGDDFDPTFPASGTLVYIDENNDGLIDVGDTLFDPSSDLLSLTADQTVQLLVVTDIPNGLTSADTGDVELTATSTTVIDNGTPGDPAGTIYENEGDGGVDAIVGTTTAVDSGTDTYRVNQLTIDLNKVAEKIAGLGTLGLVDNVGVFQVPGDEIRYRLTFTASGDGTIDNLFITDAIPAGLDYDVGSIVVTVNGGAAATPSDSNADTDGGFKGPIPVGNPDAGLEGVVIDIEQLLGVTELTATTTPLVDYTIVIEFDTKIPAI